jgi:RHS repeat-associated protein
MADVSAVPLRDSGSADTLRAFFNAILVTNQTADANADPAGKATCQTSTLLPDGRLLLLGGDVGNQAVSAAYINDPVSGATTQLKTGMHFARYCHTATVLPNGTVLIFGGIGNDGKLVETNEVFDPATLQFTLIATPGLAPRAFHTATLLTDGRVLIAGGVSASGKVTGRLDYWDYRSGKVTVSPTELEIPRGTQSATLEADGTVQFWGGVDASGQPLKSGEIFDPTTQTIQVQSSPLPPAASGPSIAVSIPADGAQSVALNAVLALRFSEPLSVSTVNDDTVTLTGPSGKVPIKVVPAEGGMLAFITSTNNLAAASQYTLSIFGATDPSGNRLSDTTVQFTTVGTEAAPLSAAAPNASQPNPFDSPYRKLPSLKAPKGVTAISGQVLQLNGYPLPNATLQIGSLSGRSDKTGRFLLENIPSGHQVMWIDGTTANNQGSTYGIFEDGVDVKAAQTNVLTYTIWMTALDTTDEVTIPSPTTRETIVSTPLMPGLQLHIPAGAVINDRNGNVVTKVGITLIPVSQPPFPLPAGVNVPTYFTIQPGGATFQGYWGGSWWGVGARLFYPNAENLPPGAPFNFWNYDAAGQGWYVYGQGAVTADGKEVVPNSGVEIYGFTGAMVGNPPYPSTGPDPGNPSGGEPVDLETGLFVYNKTDLYLSDVIPIEVKRTYRQADSNSYAFGIGTMSNYDMYIVGDGSTYSYIKLILPDGGKVEFDRTSSGTSWTDAVYQALSVPGTWYGAQIVWNGTGWTLTMKNGTKLLFPESSGASYYWQATLIGIVDRYGNTVTLTRDSGNDNRLTRVTSPNGRWIQYTYDSSNRVTEVSDSIGRNVIYTYDTSGRLSTVQDANGGTTTFTYDANNNMTTIKDARGIVYLTNTYNSNQMVSQQTLADGSTYQFSYTPQQSGVVGVSGSAISAGSNTLKAGVTSNASVGVAPAGPFLSSETDVTDPRGNVRQVLFNSDGYTTSDAHAVGTPQQQTITYSPQPVSGLNLSTTDALNRTTSYTYDAMGNVTSVTAMSGRSEAETESFSYNNYGEVASITDPLGRTTTLTYDNLGNMVKYTGTDSNSSSFTYNTTGQPVSVTDPLGNTTQLAYSGPDISGITDPLNHQDSIFADAAGRIAEVTDPLGDSAQINYSPLDQVTSQTDPLGGTTSMSYDPNGNVASLTDALHAQNPTKFVNDNLDRLQTRTDSLGNSESYQYDGNGNLTQFTDRNGNITTYQYDALNRLIFAGFGTQPGPTYQSTISYTWDAGNRLTQVLDSIAGRTTIGYDDFNRVTSVSSPQGSVSYTYDALGRRQTMTVAGQPQVTYSYDSGDRVTQITQGSSVVQIGYDADGWRTSLNLPNGVIASYSYNADSELTGISYTQGGSVLGDLTYTYNAAGHVATVGGSLAHTVLPQPVSSLTYNADNQLTGFGGTQFTYDLDGNLVNDGAHAYTWDSRGHLAALDGGNTASFVYGPFGRRISKTVYGTTTGYLYDGSNVVQELSGSTPNANLLNGGLDEVLTRTDSNGALSYLRDGLGSTAALTDSTGAVQQSYTYGPYGYTSASGNATSNSYQYTGRETDATGLYYYRARYYNPNTGRFLSEDPIGFDGGSPNLYSYAFDDPINFGDPSGDQPLVAAGAGGGAVILGLAQFIPGVDVVVDGGLLLGAGTLGLVALSKDAARNFTNDDANPATDTDGPTTGRKPEPPNNPCSGRGNPKRSPKAQPPTNPPQNPPTNLPPGWTLRQMPGPSTAYPDFYPYGYWRLYNEKGQPIDPSTMNPGNNGPETHIPFPAPCESE